jgi:hypothetical protein
MGVKVRVKMGEFDKAFQKEKRQILMKMSFANLTRLGVEQIVTEPYLSLPKPGSTYVFNDTLTLTPATPSMTFEETQTQKNKDRYNPLI